MVSKVRVHLYMVSKFGIHLYIDLCLSVCLSVCLTHQYYTKVRYRVIFM